MATMQIELDFTPRMPEQARERIEAGMAQADENADIRWKRIFDDCPKSGTKTREWYQGNDPQSLVDSIEGTK